MGIIKVFWAEIRRLLRRSGWISALFTCGLLGYLEHFAQDSSRVFFKASSAPRLPKTAAANWASRVGR